MTEQHTDQMETQPTQQPIIINNVMGQTDDNGKKKAPGPIKVCAYSVLTGGIYFLYWIAKMLSGGYRKR